MLKIEEIEIKSIAEKIGILKNDNILSINNNNIDDILDLRFYAMQFPLEIKINRQGNILNFLINEEEDNLGIVGEELKIKHCGNNCVFCFVSQNPKGLRNTLYIRDEDYRYSFLYGSYFTMTTIKEKEMKKIITQKLTPLYISVHSTNIDIRQKLLGIKKNDGLLDKMRYLAENGIEMHTQIVMCPDMNDKNDLKNTIMDMYEMYPSVLSVAVVPLGKTNHRDNLLKLRSVTKEDAAGTIKIIEELQTKFLNEIGTRFVFPADEFFLKGELDIPKDEYYEEFSQYEDGVGMVRSFISDFEDDSEFFPKTMKKKINILIVTGKSFYKTLTETITPELEKIKKFSFKIVEVENTLFGKEITVAGLIGGKDIINVVECQKIKPDILMLPTTSINYDKLLIDSMSIEDLEAKLNVKIVVCARFKDFFDDFG